MSISDDNNTGITSGWAGNVEIVPNPSNGQFSITLSNIDVNSKGLHIQVYDMRGKVVYQREISHVTERKHAVNIIDQPMGTYMVKVIANGKLYTKRIVKL